jgi:drug/metabolite transporter (DMT)-like permease
LTKIGIGLSVIGGVIIGAGDFATGVGTLLGDFLALAGSLCAACYLLLGRTLRRKLSLLAYVMICYGSAAVILWATVLALRLPVAGFSGRTYAAFGGMALISQIIGHSSYNWALRWFSTGLIAVSLLGEPIGATILAYLLFDEGLTWAKAAGGLLILSAIYLSGRGEEAGARSEVPSDSTV